jgi:hypothetical protein
MSIEYAKLNKMKSTYTEDLFYKQFKVVFGDFQKKTSTCNIYFFNKITKEEIKEHIMSKLFKD